MVAYNGVHVVVWWCDCYTCLAICVFWPIEVLCKPENGTVWELNNKFFRSPMNFWLYCQLETALHDTQETWQTFSFRYYLDFWDLCYKIPEKEQPTGVIGQWFPKATGINQSPRQLLLDNGPQSLIWVAKCAYIFLDRRSSMIKSSELSLSSRT